MTDGEGQGLLFSVHICAREGAFFVPSFSGTLSAGVVDGVVFAAGPREDQLADGEDVVALLEEVFQNGGQGLGGVKGGIVEEDDGSRSHLGGDPVGDGGGIVVLPVQAVPAGSGCKRLEERDQPGSAVVQLGVVSIPDAFLLNSV